MKYLLNLAIWRAALSMTKAYGITYTESRQRSEHTWALGAVLALGFFDLLKKLIKRTEYEMEPLSDCIINVYVNWWVSGRSFGHWIKYLLG